MTEREYEILAGDPLTDDEKERLHRIRRRKGARMKVSKEDEFFYSITHEKNAAEFREKVEAREQKYHELKARQRNGEFLEREDFLLVKLMDQKWNVLRSRRGCKTNSVRGPQVMGGGFQP
jgi:hypothetical protein